MAGGQALQGVRLPTATEMGWQGHSPGTDTEPQQRAGARPESTRGRTFASVMALWRRRDVIGTHAAFGQRGQSRQLANDPVPCLPAPLFPRGKCLHLPWEANPRRAVGLCVTMTTQVDNRKAVSHVASE